MSSPITTKGRAPRSSTRRVASRFSLGDETTEAIEVSEVERKALKSLAAKVNEHMDSCTEKEFSTHLYDVARELEIESGDFFPAVYKALIGKEKGPRLISFL